jgi:hypothetical protein
MKLTLTYSNNKIGLMSEICPHRYERLGCQLAQGRGLCNHVIIERVSGGDPFDSDSLPTGARCSLMNIPLEIGYHFEKRNIPPPDRTKNVFL